MSDQQILVVLVLLAAFLLTTPWLYVFWAKGRVWKETVVFFVGYAAFMPCLFYGGIIGILSAFHVFGPVEPYSIVTRLTHEGEVYGLIFLVMMIYMVVCSFWLSKKHPRKLRPDYRPPTQKTGALSTAA